MKSLAIVLKTTHGGLWTSSQIIEARSRGWEVNVFTPFGDGVLTSLLKDLGDADPQVKHHQMDKGFLSKNPLTTMHRLVRLRARIKSTCSSVVFYHLYESAIFARLATIGLPILRVHMIAGPLFLENTFIAWIEKYASKLDHIILAGSEFTARKYIKYGTKPDRIFPVNYGVNLEKFEVITPEERFHYRKEFGIGPTNFVAVMVAYFYGPKRLVFPGVGIKGHEILLQAWQEFSKDAPDAILYLVGGGHGTKGMKYRQEIIDRFLEIDSSGSVIWVDSTNDVRKYYAIADVSVSPSLSENHGAAVEAGALGIPSIVSSAGALPETLPEEGGGWVTQKGEVKSLYLALKQAHSSKNSGALHRMGEISRKHVEAKFDSQHQARLVFDAIEDRIKNPK